MYGAQDRRLKGMTRVAHARIHPAAIVDAGATLAPDVEIGAFAQIGAGVEIGAGTRIGSHAVIEGATRIGRDNVIAHFACVGVAPQDRKYAGEPTRLEIGDRNIIREYATISRGTEQGGGVTRLGHDNCIMAYAHIAHDCELANHVTVANGASLAGHVWIDDYAILGGFSLVHQFCRFGTLSFSGMGSAINQDVPPYVLVAGHPAHPRGINSTGLRRHGYSSPQVILLRRAYRTLYRSGLPLHEAMCRLRAMAAEAPEVGAMVDFISGSTRGIRR